MVQVEARVVGTHHPHTDYDVNPGGGLVENRNVIFLLIFFFLFALFGIFLNSSLQSSRRQFSRMLQQIHSTEICGVLHEFECPQR